MAKPIVERVLSRYAAAVLDEKMKALLLKLRKGADASLSLTGLFKVLGLLGGWNVEKIVGLVQMHGHTDKNAPESFAHDTMEQAEWEYNRLKSKVVTSLPSDPKIGEEYVMELESIKSWENSYSSTKKFHGSKYKVWRGAPGYRITDPHGKVFELLPGKYDLKKLTDPKAMLKSLHMYDLRPWLRKETSYLQQINELLGMEAHEPAAPRTRDNTGTCAVCFRNIKLVQKGEGHPVMALHGYNRPGHGYVIGKCWGGEHPPYELSPEATGIILKFAEEVVVTHKTYLAGLSSPNLTEFDEHKWWLGGKPKMFIKAEADKISLSFWGHKLEAFIEESKRHVANAEHERNVYKYLVEKWEKRVLPKEGERLVDYMTIADRKVRT